MAAPSWYDASSPYKIYYNPENQSSSPWESEGAYAVYSNRDVTDPNGYRSFKTSQDYYAPDYEYQEGEAYGADPGAAYDAPGYEAPNYWWDPVNQVSVAGTEQPQAGWIPVTTGVAYTDDRSYLLNPDYDASNIFNQDMRGMYGIEYGDAYTVPGVDDGEDVIGDDGRDPAFDDPFDDGVTDKIPELVIGDDGKPGVPDTRSYGFLQGEEFFNGLYDDPYYQQYLAPFMQNGETIEDLALRFSGVPVVSGYWTVGANGEEIFVPEQSLFDVATLFDELGELDFQSFDEWMAANDLSRPELINLQESDPYAMLTTISDKLGEFPDITDTDAYRGIGEIGEQFEKGGTYDADGNFISDQSVQQVEEARAAGFLTADGQGDLEAYNAWKTSQGIALDSGASAQQGLYGTDNEWQQDRAHFAESQMLIQSNQQMLEAIGLKSTSAAYSKMASISNQIAYGSLAYEAKKSEQHLLLQQYNYEQLKQRYDSLTERGLEAGDELGRQMYANRMAALGTYASEIAAMIDNEDIRVQGLGGQMAIAGTQLGTLAQQNSDALQQHNQTIQEYNQSLQAVAAHADTVFRTIMTDIGYDESLMAQAEQNWNSFMSPYYVELESWYQKEIVAQGGEALDIEAELAAGQASVTAANERTANVGNLFAAMGSGALTGAVAGSAIPGLGTLGGAITGGLIGLAGWLGTL